MNDDQTKKTIDLRNVKAEDATGKPVDNKKPQDEAKVVKDKGKVEHSGVLHDLRDN